MQIFPTRFLRFWTAALFALCCATVAQASDKDEAMALVQKAATHVNAVGKDKALADFSKPQSDFVKGALYVFAYSLDGVIIAHPMNNKLIGKNMTDVKDADGKLFTQEFVATAKSAAGKGWVDYRWTNPESKKIEAKSSYIQKVGDIFVGCGIYKQ